MTTTATLLLIGTLSVSQIVERYGIAGHIIRFDDNSGELAYKDCHGWRFFQVYRGGESYLYRYRDDVIMSTRQPEFPVQQLPNNQIRMNKWVVRSVRKGGWSGWLRLNLRVRKRVDAGVWRVGPHGTLEHVE